MDENIMVDNILGVPVVRNRRCRNCNEPIVDDGYGSWIHDETNRYTCGDDKAVAE